MTSIQRSLNTAQTWAEQQQAQVTDYFSQAGNNQICWDLQRAQVTGWLVFGCAAGQNWLQQLPEHQLQLIWPWVSADRWQPVLAGADFQQVQQLLSELGF